MRNRVFNRTFRCTSYFPFRLILPIAFFLSSSEAHNLSICASLGGRAAIAENVKECRNGNNAGNCAMLITER